MKIAILGGSTLLDVIFLNILSQDHQDLDLDCYGEIEQISFGQKILKVKRLDLLDSSKHDIIINFSKNYINYHETIKKNTKIYWNCFENHENSYLLPDFACIPIHYFLTTMKNITQLDIVNLKCIGELGKDFLNKFHREIQETQLNIINESNINPLAFSYNIDCLENQEQLQCELNIFNYIKDNFKLEISINAVVSPVNKSSVLILNFQLNEELELEDISKVLEKNGFVQSSFANSSVLIENDDQIYFAKLKKTKDRYSITLVYDVLYVYSNWLISQLKLSNTNLS